MGLKDLQNSAVSWAYDLDPVKKNLYQVSSFTVGSIIKNNENGESEYKYRLQSINIPQISLSFENTFAVNRDPTITSTEKKWDITIDWLESYNRQVQFDHIKWFNSWYSYSNDYLMKGKSGTLTIEVLNDDGSTVYTITIHDMIPKSLPSIEFGYDNSGDSKYTVTYSYSYGEITHSEAAREAAYEYFVWKTNVQAEHDMRIGHRTGKWVSESELANSIRVCKVSVEEYKSLTVDTRVTLRNPNNPSATATGIFKRTKVPGSNGTATYYF